MARKLKPSEFYYNLARLFKRNDKDVQNEWEIFIEFMINELQRYGAVRLPNLGEFIVVQKVGNMNIYPLIRQLKIVVKSKVFILNLICK